jgi:rhodanese-related sulfurtransferase
LLIPEKTIGQNVTGVSSLEFYENHLHLLDDGGALIIDGRTATMFASGHLKNAINIDADDPDLIPLLQEHLNEPLIVVYCTTIRRTGDIIKALTNLYEGKIIYINDGIRGWQQNGLPVINKEDQLAE